MDVKNAYLSGELGRKQLEQPPELEDPGEVYNVFSMKKSINGLIKTIFEDVDQYCKKTLWELGFEREIADQCLYSKEISIGNYVMLCFPDC